MLHVRLTAFMPAHIAEHARERLHFRGDVPVRERLAACKEFLRIEMARLRERHRAGASGLTICHERAMIIDELLRHLFDYALTSYSRMHAPPAPVALVALGG